MRTGLNAAKTKNSIFTLCAVVVLVLVVENSHAEPYLAVAKGMQCSACHSQPAGGGMRNAYGNVFAQSELAAQRLGGADESLWTGSVGKWLAVGGNLRGGYEYIDTPDEDAVSEFDVTRGTLYIEAQVIPNRLSVYIDQQFAPDASQNREAYIKLRNADGRLHLMAGQFYLPYGLRLQDDSAFIRRATGINFTNPDRGVQLGYENRQWSTQLSVTNGTGGGAELDTGKQVSLVTQFVRPRWRVGASLNSNAADLGDREMGGIFLGLKTGPIAWLAEADFVRDEIPGSEDRNGIAGLVEGNWMFRKGHNVKVSYDYLDPDRDINEDHQVRYSVLWEYSPFQFFQSRIGARTYDGPPQFDVQNRDEFFIELHGFF